MLQYICNIPTFIPIYHFGVIHIIDDIMMEEYIITQQLSDTITFLTASTTGIGAMLCGDKVYFSEKSGFVERSL